LSARRLAAAQHLEAGDAHAHDDTDGDGEEGHPSQLDDFACPAGGEMRHEFT
jgi:hypothetical protein